MIVSEAVAICLLALAVGCALGVIGAELFVGRSGLSGLIHPTYTATTFAWGLAFALGVARARRPLSGLARRQAGADCGASP